jgi:hypothetical protein
VAALLRESEIVRRDLPSRDPLRHGLKEHETQLRVVGDTIAWLILDAHTIRSLAKAPGRPASIVGQDEGFQRAADLALQIADAGQAVLLTDVTNVVRTGDLVALGGDGVLDLIECKSSNRGRSSPRAMRQTRRASRIAGYLGQSVDPSLGGAVPALPDEGLLVSIDGLAPSYRTNELAQAVKTAGECGAASVRTGEDELVIVAAGDASLHDGLEFIVPDLARVGGASLRFGFSTDLVNDPSPHHPPVTLWDLDIHDRIRLMEKELLVCHAIRDATFLGVHQEDPSIEIVEVMENGELRASTTMGDLLVGRRMVGSALYQWETPESVKRRSLEFIRQAVAEDPDRLGSGSAKVRLHNS